MPWNEERVDRTIGVLLRAGVVIAAVIVTLAVAWYHTQVTPDAHAYRVFRGEPAELSSPTAVVNAALHGHPAAWIQLGLLVLIATPVVRVGYSIAAFALQRDWTYVVITIIVLAVLLYGLW
jgi:uncharacterized membrane protein